MSSDEAGAGDTPRPTNGIFGLDGWLWKTYTGSVTVFLVTTIILLSVFLSFTGYGEELRTGTAVDGTEVTQGEDVFDEIYLESNTIHATLSTSPSELGAAKVYLYKNGENLDNVELHPKQTSFYFHAYPDNTEDTMTLLVVDGSNNPVSEVQITFKEVDLYAKE